MMRQTLALATMFVETTNHRPITIQNTNLANPALIEPCHDFESFNIGVRYVIQWTKQTSAPTVTPSLTLKMIYHGILIRFITGVVYLKATRDDTEDLRALFARVAALKSTRRSGWVKKLGLESAESVADHSYATTFMATVYADIMGLDACKIARMSLLHDLAESITGDITPDAMTHDQKESKEDAAMKLILELFPKEIRQKYIKTWTEYRMATSRESVILKQVDKLEMAFQAQIYSQSGPHKIDSFVSTARDNIKDPRLLSMLDECVYEQH